MNTKLKAHILRTASALGASPFEQLSKVGELLLAARSAEKWIFTAGNGGSASTASHMANDMVKGLSIEGHRRFRTMCLVDCTPVVTALANDYDYSRIFV